MTCRLNFLFITILRMQHLQFTFVDLSITNNLNTIRTINYSVRCFLISTTQRMYEVCCGCVYQVSVQVSKHRPGGVYLMRQHELSEEGVLHGGGLRRGGRERRAQPGGGVARRPQRTRQPPQRELHVVRRQPPAAVVVHLCNDDTSCYATVTLGGEDSCSRCRDIN